VIDREEHSLEHSKRMLLSTNRNSIHSIANSTQLKEFSHGVTDFVVMNSRTIRSYLFMIDIRIYRVRDHDPTTSGFLPKVTTADSAFLPK
jgi:hypothetical protein